MKEKKKISPDYPRIPHLAGKSNLSEDDIEVSIEFGFDAYVQEKVDGANCGISWDDDGPILRNRTHILRKGYEKNTPAKKQFVPAWNWLYEKESAIKEVLNKWQGQLTIYGEWMLAKHSIGYDKLPDYFLAYDIWSCDDKKFISPKECAILLEGTGINWIQADKIKLDSFKDISSVLDLPSKYRNGDKEGVVVKTVDENDKWVEKIFKVVKSDFQRMDENWNDKPLEKNKISFV